jgi:hypothetical protein
MKALLPIWVIDDGNWICFRLGHPAKQLYPIEVIDDGEKVMEANFEHSKKA